MGKPRGGEKADADKTGSGGKRAMISRRCWSSAYMTPADVTPFKAACHPPRGCCGRRIAQQTGCRAPGWDWFTGQTYCTVRAGERTGACVSAPLTLCAHWTGLCPQGTPAAKNCITHTSTWKGIVYVSGVISHFLWENQFRTVNKILALVSCSAQGLDFDLMLQLLFSHTIPLKGYRFFCKVLSGKFSMPSSCQRARSTLLTLEKVKVQLPFFSCLGKLKSCSIGFVVATL